MAHFNSLRSDTSNDLKRAPLKGAVLNLHWYKSFPVEIFQFFSHIKPVKNYTETF